MHCCSTHTGPPPPTLLSIIVWRKLTCVNCCARHTVLKRHYALYVLSVFPSDIRNCAKYRYFPRCHIVSIQNCSCRNSLNKLPGCVFVICCCNTFVKWTSVQPYLESHLIIITFNLLCRKCISLILFALCGTTWITGVCL